jgi:hypothetical protein
MRRYGFLFAFGMAALMLAMLAVFVAVGFASLSLYQLFLTAMSPPLAAFATSLAALLFILVLALITGVIVSATRRRDPLTKLGEALSLGKALGEDSRSALGANIPKAALIVFGLGFAIGLSPRLRRLVIGLLLR